MRRACSRSRSKSGSPAPARSRFSRSAKTADRKSTRLNSSHTEIYTLSLHDALPILIERVRLDAPRLLAQPLEVGLTRARAVALLAQREDRRSEEHTSELQSHRDLHSFPTRRSSDLDRACAP